jgi:hypothetical protein
MTVVAISLMIATAACSQQQCPLIDTQVRALPSNLDCGTSGDGGLDCHSVCSQLQLSSPDGCAFLTLPDGGPAVSCTIKLLCG